MLTKLYQNASLVLMTIPSEINTLIDRLNQKLNQIEQEATEGLDLARFTLLSFPDSTILVQFFAYFNSILLFTENARVQIQVIVESISSVNVPAQVVQQAGEDLGTLLGRTLEAKIGVRQISTRLESLS